MAEAVDVYTDQFQINVAPYGCSLNFSLSQSTPSAPGSVPQADRVATIRMSLEHLKAMTFILHRQIVNYEKQVHISIHLPVELLTAMKVREEDWQTFWQV